MKSWVHLGSIRHRQARILAILRVEVLRLLRDRTSISLILMVPAVQILLFGYAVNLEPKNITLAIARAAPATRNWLDHSISDIGYFTVVGDNLSPEAAERMVAAGDALVALEFTNSRGATPRLIADFSDPTAVRPGVLALQAALLRAAAGIVRSSGSRGIEVQWLYNPKGKSAWAIAPGLAGVVVMISMLMLGALTLVREREQGSWEGLLSTPADALDVLLGKLSPYLILGLLQAATVIGVAHLLLGVPLRGDLAALMIGALLLAAAHLVMGFTLSALAENQMQAIQGAVFFYLPSMLLSGFMFPFASMPRWAQALGNALPLTHFVRAARGVLLRGENADFVWREMLIPLAFTLVAGVAALICYRRRIN